MHKEFTHGKSIWIWRLAQCLNGDIDAIIAHCKKYNLSSVLIKNGDGANLWTQLTRDIVSQFQSNGIKVYAWAYNYGIDPLGEANVAIHNLDLGVNGFIFDAEAQYRDLPNNTEAAETMLQAVRAKYPDAFLAYTPLAIIDYHTKFPYITFGKYCDAAMPQVYYGNWTKLEQSPVKGLEWMRDNWNRWHENWKASGFADSVKPIIPIAQSYDEYKVQPPYVLNPADIHAFVTEAMTNYQGVSFYSFQHIERTDCWEAIRDARLEQTVEEPAVIVAAEEPAPVEPVQETPVVEETVVQTPAVEVAPPVVTSQGTQYQEYINGVLVTVIEPVVEAPQRVEPAPVVVAVAADEKTVETDEKLVEPAEKPQRLEMTPDQGANVAIPAGEKTTVTFKPSKDGTSMQAIVHPKKLHQEYLFEFIQWLLSLFKK